MRTEKTMTVHKWRLLDDREASCYFLFVIRTRGLTHIHLTVRNMKRSLRFYQQVFGMRESFRIGNNMVFLNTPGSKDMITLHKDSDATEIAGTSGGIAHFGFILIKSDLDAAI